MYEVEKIDYSDLVSKLEKAGNINEYLETEVFGKLGKPKWRNELYFFWISLAKAARNSDIVSSWFILQPHIRHLIPCTGPISGQFVEQLILPEIGGEDDKPFEIPQKNEELNSAEITEEDFQEEAERLDEFIRGKSGSNPDSCQDLCDWVKEFAHSGSGQVLAKLELSECGFKSLSTDAGILYLVKKYAGNRQHDEKPST